MDSTVDSFVFRNFFRHQVYSFFKNTLSSVFLLSLVDVLEQKLKEMGFLPNFLDAFLLLLPPKTNYGKIMQRGRNIFYIDCFGDIRLPSLRLGRIPFVLSTGERLRTALECFKGLGAESESDKEAQFKSFERMFLHNWA